MTTYFVSRHPGAVAWAARRGLAVDAYLAHLDPQQIQPGDTVIGILPVHLAARVCGSGARYLNLSLDMPENARERNSRPTSSKPSGRDSKPMGLKKSAVQEPTSNEATRSSSLHRHRPESRQSHSLPSAPGPRGADSRNTRDAGRGGQPQRALEEHDVLVRRLPFDDSTPEEVSASAEAIALELGAEPLVFNATGGHKLATLALAENLGALADDLHLLYAETRKDRLDWLKPTPAMQPMDDMLVIDDILRAQGLSPHQRKQFRPLLADRSRPPRHTTRRMGDEADKYGKFFGTLNVLADLALNDQSDVFDPRQSFRFKPRGDNAALLDDARKNELIHWDGGETIVFANRDAASYFRGGWLEEYVGPSSRHRPTRLGHQSKDHVVWHQCRKRVRCPRRPPQPIARNRMQDQRVRKNDAKDVSYIYKLAQLADQVGGAMSQNCCSRHGRCTTTFASAPVTTGSTSSLRKRSSSSSIS